MKVNKLLLISLLTLILSKDIVFIGDGNVYRLICEGIDNICRSPSKGSRLFIEEPIKYNGNNIKVIAQEGATFLTYEDYNKSVHNWVESILSKSKDGTIIIFWFGIDAIKDGGGLGYYQFMAKKYQNVKFYAVPITGVSSKAEDKVLNIKIQRYNYGIKKSLTNSLYSNLAYKNILKNDDPTLIFNKDLNQVVFNVTEENTTDDGLYYNKEGYEAVLKAILAGI